MQSISGGQLVVTVDERLGGELTQVRFRGVDLLASYRWRTPVGVSRSNSYGDPKLDWLSEYRGGWQLLIPNAGTSCEVEEVPLPFHGEWSRTHVTVTTRAADRVVMVAGLRLPLVVEREIRIMREPDRVLVRTTVTNDAEHAVPFVWAEHPAFAVDDGDQIDLPPVQVTAADGTRLGPWPQGSDERNLRQVEMSHPVESVHYLTGFTDGWAAVRGRDRGVALAWSIEDFPCAWLWHEIRSPGFPFYGRTSLVAIEPARCWPGDGLARAIERGQSLTLQPGRSRTATVALIPFEPDGRAVRGADVLGHIDRAPA